MQTLTYGLLTYEVDHAVKGADFIHGYDAKGNCVVAFEGVTDFEDFEYTGTYLAPEACIEEECNDVKWVNKQLVNKDGTMIVGYGAKLPDGGVEGQIFLVPDKTVITVIGDWESGIWKVRNWSNGRVECWGKAYLAEVTADTEYPDAPYSAGIRVSLPQPIADGMLIATTDSMAWVTNCAIVDNGYAYFRLVSVNAPFETMTGVTVNLHVIKDNV